MKDFLQPEPVTPRPSVTKRLPKSDQMQQIEKIIGRDLSPADEQPSDELPGVRPYKEGMPKYALDETGRLIGLNLVNTGLNDAQWVKICALPGGLDHLRILNLSDNAELRSFEFPPHPALRQLHTLDLGDCGITRFVLPTGDWSVLKDLELEGNPIKDIGPEVWAGGKAQVLAFLKEGASKGFVKCMEAKALLVGDGRAGKTTLRRRLLHGPNAPIVPSEDRTKGLEVEVEPLRLPTTSGEEIRLNLFDFGGQNHYKPLHQFFYSHRALYILVTKNGDDTNDWNFWCESALLYGGGSPVFILNNLHDTDKSDFRAERVQKMEELVKDRYDCNLLRWYPGKQNATQADYEQLERELNAVKGKLAATVQGLEHIHSEVPANWMTVRRLIEGRQKDNVIRKTEFEDICRQPDIDADPVPCLEYLRTIGACLYYSDERNLKKQVIINNNWAVKGVYRVLDDGAVKARYGRFNEQELDRIWKPTEEDGQEGLDFERYFNELNELMGRFKLYYPLKYPEQGYDRIAPSLLPKKQDEDPKWGDSPSDLRLQVRYGFIPPSLFSRFIVGMHRYIAGQNRDRVWEDEAWFEWEGTEGLAFLIEIENKKSIDIRVRGNDPEKRKTLLSFLLRELDELHEETKGIDVEKRVPCICEQCRGNEKPYFHDHAYLEELKSEGLLEERCKKSKKMVSVAALLGNVFVPFRERGADGEIFDKINEHLERDEVDDALALLKQLNKKDAVLLSGEWANLKKAYFRGDGISEAEFLEKKKSLRARIQGLAGQYRKRGF